MFFLVAKFLVDGTALKITYILEYLVKTYLNEHISLYKMALGYLIIFLQYGRVLSKKIPVYNFEGSTR